MITTDSESLNKRRRTDTELPNYTGYGYNRESQRDSYDDIDYELPRVGYESTYTTNYEPTRNYELRATTPPGYMSKTRPKSVGIDALPTELIQEGKRKRKPKHYY